MTKDTVETMYVIAIIFLSFRCVTLRFPCLDGLIQTPGKLKLRELRKARETGAEGQ